MSVKKYAEFYYNFKFVEIIGKKCTQKKFLLKTLQVSSIEEDELKFFTLFCP